MTDDTPLLGESSAARAIKLNFVRMAIMFSINHGCVTSVLNLAVLVLGDQGSYMNGSLNVMYAATALVAAPGILGALGHRRAIIAGASMYCIYVMALPLCLIAESKAAKSALAIGGGCIGGIAAGFLWTAQGAYFAASAQLYAAAAGSADDTAAAPNAPTPLEQATSAFAALFGAFYLGFELLLKMLPLVLSLVEQAIDPSVASHGGGQLTTSRIIVAVAYSACAIASAVGLTTIWDLEQRKKDAASAVEVNAAREGGGGGAAAAAAPSHAGALCSTTSSPPRYETWRTLWHSWSRSSWIARRAAASRPSRRSVPASAPRNA